jgi:hypothetical protein
MMLDLASCTMEYWKFYQHIQACLMVSCLWLHLYINQMVVEVSNSYMVWYWIMNTVLDYELVLWLAGLLILLELISCLHLKVCWCCSCYNWGSHHWEHIWKKFLGYCYKVITNFSDCLWVFDEWCIVWSFFSIVSAGVLFDQWFLVRASLVVLFAAIQFQIAFLTH